MSKRPHDHYILFTLLFIICSLNGAANTSMVYHIATSNIETEFCAAPCICLTLTQFATNITVLF